jgi:hypothetical protein
VLQHGPGPIRCQILSAASRARHSVSWCGLSVSVGCHHPCPLATVGRSVLDCGRSPAGCGCARPLGAGTLPPSIPRSCTGRVMLPGTWRPTCPIACRRAPDLRRADASRGGLARRARGECPDPAGRGHHDPCGGPCYPRDGRGALLGFSVDRDRSVPRAPLALDFPRCVRRDVCYRLRSPCRRL